LRMRTMLLLLLLLLLLPPWCVVLVCTWCAS
jgi:hypothetical protein